jgi:hypothetical protein
VEVVIKRGKKVFVGGIEPRYLLLVTLVKVILGEFNDG